MGEAGDAASTILVVDDDTSIRLLCRVNLELDGYRVVEAGSVADARRALESGEVAVVLLDVHVGSDDGIEFLHELRDTRPELPVAMLTGTADPEGVRDHNPDAMIGKPFALEELQEVVGSLAGRTTRSM